MTERHMLGIGRTMRLWPSTELVQADVRIRRVAWWFFSRWQYTHCDDILFGRKLPFTVGVSNERFFLENDHDVFYPRRGSETALVISVS